MPSIGIGIGVHRKRRVSYWTPQSLTVEDTSPTHVAITFPSAKTVLASDFTIAGFTINSGSWSGSVYTLVLSTAVIYGDSLTVVYKTKSYPVTNAVVSQYYATNFKGIPIEYTGNPLVLPSDYCMLRHINLVNGVYHIFEEHFGSDTNHWIIRKRTSVDGLTIGEAGSALFAYGAGGSFDEYGQADPTICYNGPGDWQMWFDAKDNNIGWTIGYATSVDGSSWSKYGQVLSYGAGGQWDSAFLHHPAHVKVNGTIFLFYAGNNVASLPKSIGLATSTDGIHFTKYGSNPVITVGATGSWDAAYVRPSSPIYIAGLWYMWYWGYGATTQKMGLATSPDLLTWTKVADVLNPILGIEGSHAIVRSGSNPIDKIAKIWFSGSAAAFNLNYATVAPFGEKHKLSGFANYSGNIYQISLTSEPTSVYFNGVSGNKKTSIINVTGEYAWVWVSSVLYIYSVGPPDIEYQITVPSPFIIGRWAINETSGNVLDALGLHNGTPSNVTQQTSGGVFNTTTSKIDLGNNFNFERTDKFSITFWVKRTHIDGAAPMLFTKSLASGNYTGIALYFGGSANLLQIGLVATATNSIQKRSAKIISSTTDWVHIALTYDGSSSASGLKLYVNGILDGSTTISDNLTTSIINNASFLIGSRNGALAADATIKKFQIYNDELSLADVVNSMY